MRDDSGNQPTHYFAKSRFTYARGRTREAAIANLRSATPESTLRAEIQRQGYMLVTSWLVNQELASIYPIDPVTFDPVGVELVGEQVIEVYTTRWFSRPHNPQ